MMYFEAKRPGTLVAYRVRHGRKTELWRVAIGNYWHAVQIATARNMQHGWV